MNGWFGDRRFAGSFGDTPRVERPIGAPCIWCDDPIGPDDLGLLAPGPMHHNCFFRMVVGGINHQKGICACCGGTMPSDPPELTKREAAEQAASFYRQWTANG